MIAAHQTMMGPQGAPTSQRCAVFDGASRARASAGSWTTAAQGSLSMALWIWIRALPASGPVSAMSLQNYSGSTGNGAQIDPITSATRKFRILFQNVSIIGPTSSELGGIGAWHHYAFSYNYSTHAILGYVDGTQVLSSAPNRWLNANGSLLATLGSTGNSTNVNNLDGKIANANLYLRAITASEVASLASSVDSIPTDADHQWVFANDDFTDTGTASTKWNLQIQSSTGSGTGNITFEDVT